MPAGPPIPGAARELVVETPHSRVPPGDDVYDALSGAALEDSVALLSWLLLNVEPLSAWFILYIPAPAALPAPAPRTPTLPHTHRSVSDEGALSGGGPVHGRDAHAGTAGAGQTDYVDTVLRTFFQIHIDQPPGDVLIFLPGREDIESLRKAIELLARQLRGAHCAMYVTLQGAQTNRVFAAAPRGACKCIVIVATYIAETSVTIPGVRPVVDMGKSKEKRYLAGSTGGRFDALLTRDIVQSNAMLQLLCFEQDIQELELMDTPDVDAEQTDDALRTLFLLGALDSHPALTPRDDRIPARPYCIQGARSPDAADKRGAIADARHKFAYRTVGSNGAGEGRGRRGERGGGWAQVHFVNERMLREAAWIWDQLRERCTWAGGQAAGSTCSILDFRSVGSIKSMRTAAIMEILFGSFTFLPLYI
ncbi:hypothetical protein B0H11DRAFT_2244177 [Mycena galericulata]|nr:hypothetical protein B0H11DRAFT_2244177 [Mycena galericulata]